ncbi:MAG: hypothetical protein CMI27_02305 [Opitutae bacterium]|nr:hypothetical protein [Opitutae bacterium]|tara:strand:+ start:4814 stop:5221 length:408 start_codon:yes stop_codon:yes gene_type:complete
MKMKTKAWLISQGLLLFTAFIIQITFYRGIKVGPILGMPKREYSEIILGIEPVIPDSILSQNLPPEAYDARLYLTPEQIKKANLGAYRKAAQQEEGLRTAFKGGLLVNIIYLVAFQVLFSFFEKEIQKGRNRTPG